MLWKYLCSSLQAHILKVECHRVDGVQKVSKEWHIFVFEHFEVIVVNVGREEGMCDIFTQRFHLLNEIRNRREKVESNEFDARVLPVDGKGPAGCDNYFRPTKSSEKIMSKSLGPKRVANYHSEFGVRMRCSTKALPLMPLDPATKATLVRGAICEFKLKRS
jgi:hypothetical protein